MLGSDKYQPPPPPGGCTQCVKYLLLVTNFVFILMSSAVIGVGIWVLLEKNYVSIIYGSLLFTVASYLVIIGGCLMFMISLVGCYGALLNNRCLLLTYAILLVFIFVTLLTGGILALVFRTELGYEVQHLMRKTIQESYGFETNSKSYNRMVTEAWDSSQKHLRCCSVEDKDWQLYRGSNWFKVQPSSGNAEQDRPLVPTSCCYVNQYGQFDNLQKCQTFQFGPPKLPGGELNTAIYSRGCYSAGYDFIMDYSSVLCGIGIGVSLCLIAGIILSCFMWCRLKQAY